MPTPETGEVGNASVRVRAFCRQHWLGLDVPAERKLAADTVRRSYRNTSVEHYKAANRMYELLTATEKPVNPSAPAVAQISRNIQLLLAYSTLWDAFRFIYNAACYTDFARGEAEVEPMETERQKIDRVLRTPILSETEVAGIGILRNGETPAGAVQRLCGRHSRELEQITGEAHDVTMTDMDAFMQGVVRPSIATVPPPHDLDRPWELWGVRALDDEGGPIRPDGAPNADAYRAAIKWLCYQIRLNMNFVGKSDDSLDDMILVIRAFCLLEPIVGMLLKESRQDLIFALN
jgi:hypothetical protein